VPRNLRIYGSFDFSRAGLREIPFEFIRSHPGWISRWKQDRDRAVAVVVGGSTNGVVAMIVMRPIFLLSAILVLSRSRVWSLFRTKTGAENVISR
jgi:hypothetical protein